MENGLSDLIDRFTREGILWHQMRENEKCLQLWRWLVDSESNLKSSRIKRDNLRLQFLQEKEELAAYSDHLRWKCEEKVKSLEEEVRILKSELESLLVGTEAISRMLFKEGLEEIAQGTLGDQIAYLLAERNEFINTKEHINSPIQELEKRLSKEIAQKEVYKEKSKVIEKELKDTIERIRLLEKAAEQLELEKDALSLKLSESFLEAKKQQHLYSNFDKDNETLSLPTTLSITERGGRFVENSDKNSWNGISFTGAQSKQELESFFDEKISNSKNRLEQIQEMKELQKEVHSLRLSSSVVADKYEKVLKQFETFKIESSANYETIRKESEMEKDVLLKQINLLAKDFSLKEKELENAQSLMQQMKTNNQELRSYRRDIIHKLNENERRAKSCEVEKDILKHKVNLLEETNKQLLAKIRNSLLTNCQ